MKTGCPNKPEDGESVEAQSCSYNESSQAIEEDLELASQLAGDEFSSKNISETEHSLEESKEPRQGSSLGKRLASSSSQQL